MTGPRFFASRAVSDWQGEICAIARNAAVFAARVRARLYTEVQF